MQDEVGKANKFLSEIKRIVNDIKNKKQEKGKRYAGGEIKE